MINIVENGLTFDDVLLVPKFSKVLSRSNVDVSVELSKNIKLENPLIPANMKTITGIEMAEKIYLSKAMAILHRFMDYDQIISYANYLKSKYCDAFCYIGFSVGVKDIDYDLVDKLVEIGVKIICVDIAHAHSINGINMSKYISTNYPDIFLISGNVATAEGARDLWRAGADAVKVNIGAGSLCTTRIKTGNGVPQLTAISNVWDSKFQMERQLKKKIFVFSDGGCKSSGDLVKSLCFSDMVMTGNLFAGCEESPGNLIVIDGKKYKEYTGSSTHKSNHIEGVSALVEIKSTYNDILQELLEGLKSGCSYQGVSNLNDLKINPRFVLITNSGLKENNYHSVDLLVK